MYYIISIISSVKRKKEYPAQPGILYEIYNYRRFLPCFFPESFPDLVLLSPGLPKVVADKLQGWIGLVSPDTLILSGEEIPENLTALLKEREQPAFPLERSLSYFQTLTASKQAVTLRGLEEPALDSYDFFAVMLRDLNSRHPLIMEKTLLSAGEQAFLFSPRCILYHKPSSFLLLLFYEKASDPNALGRLRKQLITKAAQDWESDAIRCHFGMIHHGMGGIYASYFEAYETYYVDRLRTPSAVYEEISKPSSSVSKPSRLVEIERSIRTDMEFCKGKNTLQYVTMWFEECQTQNYTLQNMKCDLILLYSSIKNTIFDMYVLRPQRIKIGMEVYEILNIESFEEMQEWFYVWLTYTLNNFEPVHIGSEFHISEVLAFIDSHLMEELSLEKVSSYFFLSPPYFSTLFKRKTGQTFISYLTAKKMEQAASLLRENHKVYEVAHMLGYEDVRHFRNLYKKQFGMTPSGEGPATSSNTY